jgi:hypothetical protein
MSTIRNTTAAMREDPAEAMLLLAESMGPGGPGSAIQQQERDGQRQLLVSDRLPSKIQGDRAEFEVLGFTFGDPDPDDPMFMPATLPEGWSREGSDHDMWSYLVDPAGRQRVGVFYKAAFYDRSAHMHLTGLGWYVTCHVEYDGPLVITDDWATPETVRAALVDLLADARAEAAKYRGYADEDGRDNANKAELRKIAAEKDAVAAKYAALLETFTK